MFIDFVAPILRRITAELEKVAMRIFRVANMGESIIEKKIGGLIAAIPGIELGYCARPGEVDVRVIGSAEAVAQAEEIIRKKLGNAIFTASDETLAAVLVRLLSEREQTLALAESCTGGFLADQITNVPGASKVFVAGCVTYSNEEKIRALGVSRESIERFGAVSEQVATEMAEGLRIRTGVTHGIATTGIAGPGGGSEEKPVGTAFLGLSSESQPVQMGKVLFPKRSRNLQTAGGATCVRYVAKALVVAAPMSRHPERSRGTPMRKLKDNVAGSFDFRSLDDVLCVWRAAPCMPESCSCCCLSSRFV